MGIHWSNKIKYVFRWLKLNIIRSYVFWNLIYTYYFIYEWFDGNPKLVWLLYVFFENIKYVKNTTINFVKTNKNP